MFNTQEKLESNKIEKENVIIRRTLIENEMNCFVDLTEVKEDHKNDHDTSTNEGLRLIVFSKKPFELQATIRTSYRPVREARYAKFIYCIANRSSNFLLRERIAKLGKQCDKTQRLQERYSQQSEKEKIILRKCRKNLLINH
jgi:hypothetical protein